MTSEKESRKIEEQAYAWLATLQSGGSTAEEIANFHRWLDADARHGIVFDEVSAVWSELGDLDRSLRADLMNARQRPDFASLVKLSGDYLSWLRLPRRAVLAGLTATIFGLGLFLTYQYQISSDAMTMQEAYSTPQTKIRSIELPDGSVITLGAQSEVVVDYRNDLRSVTVVAGQVFFEVESDSVRQFQVTIDQAVIRVRGTKFDVRRSPTGVGVSVLEGVVEIARFDSRQGVDVNVSATTPFVLTDNQKIQTTPNGGFSEIESISREMPGAWRQGRLIYENADLAEVISDVDRYYVGKIIIDGEELQTLPVSASFRIEHIDKMLNSLTTNLSITSSKLPNGDIILSSL